MQKGKVFQKRSRYTQKENIYIECYSTVLLEHLQLLIRIIVTHGYHVSQVPSTDIWGDISYVV